MNERWQQVEALYLEALRLSAAERSRFLNDACAGDEALEREVASLLAQDGGEFLETPAVFAAARLVASERGSLVDTTIGPYHIASLIGVGGMGEVYRATDTRLQRVVAIKVLPDRTGVSATALERFKREARAASALNHPNICTIYDIGTDPPFIAMELLEGETLQQRLTRGAIDIPALIDIALAVTDALDAAHSMGIVHRDVKPANVFLTARGPKILDFGIAQAPSDAVVLPAAEARLTHPGIAIGTVAYMSPEQVRAQPLDARTDVFSFGVMLYEMATGALPFPAASTGLMFDAILNRAAVAPVRLNPAVPAELERIVDKCLEKNRNLRYQRASDVATDLRRVRRETDGGRIAAIAPRGHAAGRTNRWNAIIPAVAAVLASIVAGYVYAHRTPGLTDKDTIVLADFTNTTGDPVFDDALRQGLAVQLEQSPFLSLVSDDRIQRTLRLMGQPADAHLTPERAREICERTASAAVLDGSIASLGSQYVLGLRARNCRNGDVLDEEQVQAVSKEDVLNALSHIASTFRQRVGESLATVEQHNTPLAEATTTSLDALKAYSAGRRVHSRSGPAALPLFKRAVELDPRFAIAYAYLGHTYGESGESALSAEYVSKAYQLRERVSDAEKFFLTVSYHLRATGDLETARKACELWAQTYPRDTNAHVFLANMIYPVLGKHEEAIEEGKRGIELDPDYIFPYAGLAGSYANVDRMAEAETVVQRAAARQLVLPAFQMYDMAFLRSDTVEMARHAALARRTPGFDDVIANKEAFVLAYAGQLQQARRESQRAADLAQRSTQPEAAALYQTGAALREAFFGNAQAAGSSATSALRLSNGREVEYGAALALALSGDSGRAQTLADDLGTRFPEDTAVRSSYLPALRGFLALNRHEPATAIELLQLDAVYDFGTPPSTFHGFFGALYPVYVRGAAFLAARRGAEAAIEFQKILDHRGLVVSDPIGALAYLQLGRAHVASGDMTGARTAYQQFLTLWKDADDDIPIFKQAQAEYARLP